MPEAAGSDRPSPGFAALFGFAVGLLAGAFAGFPLGGIGGALGGSVSALVAAVLIRRLPDAAWRLPAAGIVGAAAGVGLTVGVLT